MSGKVYFITKEGSIDSYTFDYALAEYYVNSIDAVIGEGHYKIKPFKLKNASQELLGELEFYNTEQELFEVYENEDEENHVVMNNVDAESYSYYTQSINLNIQTLINKLDFSLTYLKFEDDEKDFVRDTLINLKRKFTDYDEKLGNGHYDYHSYGIPIEEEVLDMEAVYHYFIEKSKHPTTK